MGGSQPVSVVNEEESKAEEILKKLSEIEERIHGLGLSREEFRDLLKRESIDFDSVDSLEALYRIRAFIDSREEDLRGVAEVKRELESLLKKEGVIKSEVDVYLKDKGFDIYAGIPLNKDARKRLLETIRSYKPPEIRFEIDAQTLRKLAKAVSWVTRETTVSFDEDGMKILAIDPSNVVMVVVEAGAEFFNHYSGTSRVIGIDWEKLLNCIKLESDTELEIQIENHFTIKTDSRTIKLSLVDPSALRTPPKIPNLRLDAKLFVSEFHKIVSTHQSVGDAMEITAVVGGAVLRTKNDEGDVIEDYAECECTQNKMGVLAIYSIDYLRQIASSFKHFTDRVTIYFSESCPAIFEYKGEEGVTLKYILAPRIEY